MSAKFTIDGSASGAVKAVTEVAKALNEVEKGGERATAANKRLEEMLGKQAQRIRETIEPQAKFNRLQQELKQHVEAGRLTIQQADKAAEHYAQTILKAGDSAEKSFGPRMLSHLDGMVSKMAAVAAPLAVLVKGFGEIEAAIDRAKQESADARRGMGSLRQLATSDAQYQDLRGKAEALFGTGSTKTLDEAASAVFSLASAGQLDDQSFGLFAALAKKQIADPGTLARAVKNYSSAFGAASAGDTRAIISKAFAASNYSPETVEALMAAIPQMAGAASAQGIGDEESLAALAVLSSSVGGPQAATLIKAFLSGTAGDKKLGGLDITQRVDALAAGNLSFAELKKRLGSVEAATAFDLLRKNMPDILAAESSINRANTDPFAVAARLAFTDPESDAALSEQQIANMNVLRNRREAAFGAIRSGTLAQWRQNLIDYGNEGTLQRIGAAFGLGAMAAGEWIPEWGSNNEGWVRAAAQHHGGQLGADQQAALEALNRSANASERTSREIEKLNATQRSRVTTRQE